MSEFRITTDEVANPNHDRRYKYGEAGIQSVPAGTAIVHYPQRQEKYVTPARVVVLRGDRETTVSDPEFVASLLGKSAPAEPRTVREIVLAMGSYEWALLEAIEWMYRDGRIDRATLELYIRRVEEAAS